MTPGNKFQNILTLASIAISLCVRSIRTSSISYSLTYATAALHSALPHNHVWNILTSLSHNSGSLTPEINSWTYSHSYHSYFLMRTIHTYINHKLFINSCNCCTTQCFTTTPKCEIHCHKLQQLIHIQCNVNASHQNTHK